jgi:streptogramin lyase
MRANALILLAFACPAFAHSVVDVGVAIRCPAFVAPNAAAPCTIDVTDYAYDIGLGIVVTAALPANSKFISASGSGWNCPQSKGVVTCSAEEISPGTSAIAVSWNAPASGTTVRMTASVQSLGTVDDVPRNDNATSDSTIYNPAACTANAPALFGPSDEVTSQDGSVDFSWAASTGAAGYRIWAAVEGAAPSIIAETTDLQTRRSVEFGASEWWVEAIFAACPSLTSSHRRLISHGSPARFDIATLAAGEGGTPASVGVDLDGNIYVVDSESSTLRHIAPNGAVTTVAGIAGQAGSTDGPPGLATMNHPRAVAVTPGGYVYVADTDNNTIRQFFPNGNGATLGPILVTIAGARGIAGLADATGGAARFDHPAGIFVPATGTIHVADTRNNVVRQFGGITLDVVTSFGKSGQLSAPAGVIAAPDGTLFVSDTGHDVVRKIARDGTITTFPGFHAPSALAFDAFGNLYVADTGSDSILRIAPSGLVTTVVPPGILSAPTGIAIDANGRMLIADAGNHVIRVATRAVSAPPPAPGAPRRRGVRH